jgi:hypothetical protein
VVKRRKGVKTVASECSRTYRFRMKEKSKRIAITLGGSFLKKVDEWRRKQRDRPSLAVAVRRLAEVGLAGSLTSPRKERSRRKAAEMADREIERRLADQAVNNEERDRRKRRLIQGPREFRDMRGGRSKNNA